MVSRLLKALVTDLVLIILAFSVLGDLQGRNSYALSEPRPLTPSYRYVPLVQYFTLTGDSRPFPLQSAPTLDWLQVLFVIGVAVNVWYGYHWFKEKRSTTLPTPK